MTGVTRGTLDVRIGGSSQDHTQWLCGGVWRVKWTMVTQWLCGGVEPSQISFIIKMLKCVKIVTTQCSSAKNFALISHKYVNVSQCYD